MNVEYVKLSDGTTIVTNKSGTISKRKDDISSNTLLIENKIEVVENEINQSQKKIKDFKGIVYLAKYMMLFQPIIFLGAAIVGKAPGDLINILGCGIGCVAVTGMWGGAFSASKSKIKGYEGKLKKAEELKSEYEKELAEEKELVVKRELTINEPISLVQQNEYELPLIDEQLETAYCESIHSKPKKLVLERKLNRRK